MNLKRILLVEDDTEDQYLFTLALDSLNLNAYCKAVNNGQEALDHLNNIANYEIIFLDLNMPIMNGVDCLKALKENENCRHIPVVIITTSMNPFELDNCKKMGVAHIFHKPNSFPELCKSLQSILMN